MISASDFCSLLKERRLDFFTGVPCSILAEVMSYLQANPDITVEVSPVSWEVLYPQILADITSKTGAFDVTTWDLMTAGSIAKGMLDLEKFGKEHPDLVDPNFDKDDFIPAAFYVYGMWEGKNIGYPFYGATMFLFYRKDYFLSAATIRDCLTLLRITRPVGPLGRSEEK